MPLNKGIKKTQKKGIYAFKKAYKFLFFLLLLSITKKTLFAQNNVGVKFFGLSIHPKGERDNAFLMPNKIDKNAYLVVNLGGELMYEKFFVKDVFSIKIIQSVYADCAGKTGGFSHIGIRAKILRKNKHALYGGIGPTFVFRKNWLELNGYVNQNRFKGNDKNKWQHLFLWYGGEFEYKYTITKRLDFSSSFVPGYPDLMSIAFGVNLKLNK